MQNQIEVLVMPDSIPPVNSSLPPSTKKRQAADARSARAKNRNNLETERKAGGNVPLVERRKSPDRRKNTNDTTRPLYDMRSGQERRKRGSTHPSIDIDA